MWQQSKTQWHSVYKCGRQKKPANIHIWEAGMGTFLLKTDSQWLINFQGSCWLILCLLANLLVCLTNCSSTCTWNILKTILSWMRCFYLLRPLSMEITKIIISSLQPQNQNMHFYNPLRNTNFYLINGFSVEITNSVTFSEQRNDQKSQSWLDM